MEKKQHDTRRGRGGRLGLLVLGTAVLVLGALALGARTLSGGFPRLETAGFRIGEEEYLRAMYQARNEVLSAHAAAGISLKDWSSETELGDPCRMTMDRALEILDEYYAVSLLAVERGYLEDAGYDAMLESLEEINRQRQEALDAGAMVTGIPSFTVEDYLTYRSSGLKLQFCSDPDNSEYAVTPEEIRQRYEADRDSLYRQPDAMELRFLLADVPSGEAEELEKTFEQARELGDLAAAVEALPRLADCYQEISVHPGNYGAYARSHGDVLAWAAELQPGELSQVFRREDRLCLIECLGRTANTYVPLEEVESIVVQSIRESRYDALIARRMEEMEISGDLKQLYRFTAEQLQ